MPSYSDEDPVVNQAVFGKQVIDFLHTPIGKYLVRKAEEDVECAMEQLKSVASWRRRKIQELQNKVKTAEQFQQWLGDAIVDGEQALKILEDE